MAKHVRTTTSRMGSLVARLVNFKAASVTAHGLAIYPDGCTITPDGSISWPMHYVGFQTAAVDFNEASAIPATHYVVYSYSTPILVYDGATRRWVVNAKTYSRTTSRHMTLCVRGIPPAYMDNKVILSESNVYKMLHRGGLIAFTAYRMDNNIQFPLFTLDTSREGK